MSITRTLPLLIAVAVVVVAGSAQAGPNEGVVLTPHGNVNGLDPIDHPCVIFPIPPTCEETDPNAAPDSELVDWFIVLAAGSGELSFSTITFGLGDFDPYECYIVAFGPCFPELNPLEITSAGWPSPNSGTSVSWAPNCLQGTLVPVYYFAFYAYPTGGPVPLGDFYPGRPASVISCGDPPQEDPIAGFGVMGCGEDPGLRVCPAPVPTSPSTWGQIKAIYR